MSINLEEQEFYYRTNDPLGEREMLSLQDEKRIFFDNYNETGLPSVAELAQLTQDLNDIQTTYAALGNTVADNSGLPNNSGVLTFAMTGTNDELLTPPINPQPISNPDLNGYIQIPLNVLSQSGFLSDSGDGGLLVGVGGSGFYTTPHAWLTKSSTAINNNIGFIFGIHRGSNIFFSPRITQQEMANGNDTTNLSGGGFVDLQEGDKLYVYGSSEQDCTMSLYDCNLGVAMRYKA